MLTVEENENTESHILRLLGLTIGFDDTEWFDGELMLSYEDKVVAMLSGELLTAFMNIEYVKENRLAE